MPANAREIRATWGIRNNNSPRFTGDDLSHFLNKQFSLGTMAHILPKSALEDRKPQNLAPKVANGVKAKVDSTRPQVITNRTQGVKRQATSPISTESSAKRSDGTQAWLELLEPWAQDKHPKLAPFLMGEAPVKTLVDTRLELERQLAELETALQVLPKKEELEPIANAQAAFLEAPPTAKPEIKVLPPFEDLADIHALLTFMGSDAHEKLPTWALLRMRGKARDWHVVLKSETESQRTLQVAQWIDAEFKGEIPDYFASLKAQKGGSILQDLKAAVKAHLDEVAALEPWKDLLDMAFIVANHPKLIPELVQALKRWQVILSKGALRDLCAQFSSPKVAEVLAECQALEFGHLTEERQNFMKQLGEWRLVSIFIGLKEPSTRKAALPSKVQIQSVERSPRTKAAAPVEMRVGHGLSNEEGKIIRPTLVIPPPKEGGLTSLAIPLRITAAEPYAKALNLEIEGTHLEVMPIEKEMVQGGNRIISRDGKRLLIRKLSPEKDDWDRGEGKEQSTYHLDVIVPVPAYKHHRDQWLEAGRDLKLRVSAAPEGGQGHRAKSRELTFDKLVETAPQLAIPIADTTSSDEMMRSPLGVQEDYEAFTQSIGDGRRSFFIAAPRRFGKTTLLHHLKEAGESAEPHSCVHIALNRSSSPMEAMKRVIEGIKEQVEIAFGSCPSLYQAGDKHPNPHTFKKLRRFLHEKGLKTLRVFIDEAQAMVPKRDQGRWGGEFKPLIEDHLSREAKGQARIIFILVGTGDLPTRLGTNCSDFLSGKEVYEFSEHFLARFLRTHGQGEIRSTAAARQRLAAAANNLWSLLRLLECIGTAIHKSGRAYFLTSDVKDAETLLLREAKDEGSRFWNHVSAELNSIDDGWEPVDAYPVALALSIQGRNQGAESLREHTRLWLEERLRDLGIQEPHIPPKRIEESFKALQRIKIIDKSGRFRRSLLRALLEKRAREPFEEDADNMVLMRLAVDAVQLPSGAEQCDGGGQAKIYTSEVDGKVMAWRVCDLADDDNNRRFMKTCTAIRVMKEPRSRVEGDAHLPYVRKAGIDPNHHSRGILVYDWIEGEKLSTLEASLDPLAQIEILRQVALALSALHQRCVVHRDVHGRNILVDGHLKAYLIDFGLACLEGEAGQTQVGLSGSVAPEVSQGLYRASPQSDVYALGHLLKGVLDRAQDASLSQRFGTLVDGALSAQRASRPDAIDLAQDLALALKEAGYHPEKGPAKKAVEDRLLDVMEGGEWLYELLQEFEAEFTLYESRLRLPDAVSHAQAAKLINESFVAWVRERACKEAEILSQLTWQQENGRGSVSLAALPPVLSRSPGLAAQVRKMGWGDPRWKEIGDLRNRGAHPSRNRRGIQGGGDSGRRQNGKSPVHTLQWGIKLLSEKMNIPAFEGLMGLFLPR